MRKSTAITRALAAAILLLAFQSGFAQELPLPGPSSSDQHVIIDSTSDVGHGGKSVDFNATFAPFGSIDETGFRLRLTPSYSGYKFKLGDDQGLGSGHSFEYDILPGVGIAAPRANFIVLFGPAFVESHSSGTRTFQTGFKTVASVYATPTDQTMFYGSVNYVTLGSSYQVQLKTGIKVPANFYIGPEFKVSGGYHNTQKRIGAHLSSIKVGEVLVSVGAGFLRDDQLGSGPYTSVSLYTSF